MNAFPRCPLAGLLMILALSSCKPANDPAPEAALPREQSSPVAGPPNLPRTDHPAASAQQELPGPAPGPAPTPPTAAGSSRTPLPVGLVQYELRLDRAQFSQ